VLLLRASLFRTPCLHVLLHAGCRLDSVGNTIDELTNCAALRLLNITNAFSGRVSEVRVRFKAYYNAIVCVHTLTPSSPQEELGEVRHQLKGLNMLNSKDVRTLTEV
jgi:hypothetical protein